MQPRPRSSPRCNIRKSFGPPCSAIFCSVKPSTHQPLSARPSSSPAACTSCSVKAAVNRPTRPCCAPANAPTHRVRCACRSFCAAKRSPSSADPRTFWNGSRRCICRLDPETRSGLILFRMGHQLCFWDHVFDDRRIRRQASSLPCPASPSRCPSSGSSTPPSMSAAASWPHRPATHLRSRHAPKTQHPMARINNRRPRPV